MPQDHDEPQIYTDDDEPLTRHITKAVKRALGLGPKDVNLPDEQEETPRRRRAYDLEVSDDQQRKSDKAIKSLQDYGRRIGQSEMIKNLKRKGLSEEEATRQALGGK